MMKCKKCCTTWITNEKVDCPKCTTNHLSEQLPRFAMPHFWLGPDEICSETGTGLGWDFSEFETANHNIEYLSVAERDAERQELCLEIERARSHLGDTRDLSPYNNARVNDAYIILDSIMEKLKK